MITVVFGVAFFVDVVVSCGAAMSVLAGFSSWVFLPAGVEGTLCWLRQLLPGLPVTPAVGRR